MDRKNVNNNREEQSISNRFDLTGDLTLVKTGPTTDRIVVPAKISNKILKIEHGSAQTIHPVSRRLFHPLPEEVYWSSLS